MIDMDSDPALRDKAVRCVKDFCSVTGINLAGFDLLFSADAKPTLPLFLEINYYFGRRGLGGSETFYSLLESEIEQWIESLGFH